MKRLLLLLPLLLLTSCDNEKYKYCVHLETNENISHYVCSRVVSYTKSNLVVMYTRDYGQVNACGDYIQYELPNKCPVCGWEELL
jgi:hypothetical protein